MTTTSLGFPDKGLRQALKFLVSAEEHAQALPLVFALNGVATISAWPGEAVQALKYADDLLALTAEHGFSNWLPVGQFVHGLALALLGRADEAIAEIKTAFDSYEATGAVIPGYAYANLALAFLAAKQPEEGLRVAAKALEVSVWTSDAEAKVELHRLHGELMLMSNSAQIDGAEASFRAAIETARKQRVKFHELRSTTSLAQLLRNTGRRDEARTILAEIYNWFTEGFDTADLKAAKALRDELSG
jgi:tetratricopeptide (TPR) repeat protein